jgi:hypothetical protein
MSPHPRTLKSRFGAKWFHDQESGCWIWTAALFVLGYGKIFVDGRLRPAHRIGWQLYVGAIPAGTVLDHKCRRKNCVNPKHLEIVTVGENTRRRNLDLLLPEMPHLRLAKRKLTLRERFDAKWMCDDATGCWNWTAQINCGGYGCFSKNGRLHLAHRVAYELYQGAIPSGLFIDHLCRNRRCVNPAHLEPVTNQVNVDRGTVATVNRARQLAKTHCRNGHLLSGENLYIAPSSGQRVCRICRVERKRRARCLIPKKPLNRTGLALGGSANGKRQRAKTHCPKGHPYSGDNLRINKRTGYRECRKCAAEATKRSISRKLNK